MACGGGWGEWAQPQASDFGGLMCKRSHTKSSRVESKGSQRWSALVRRNRGTAQMDSGVKSVRWICGRRLPPRAISPRLPHAIRSIDRSRSRDVWACARSARYRTTFEKMRKNARVQTKGTCRPRLNLFFQSHLQSLLQCLSRGAEL